ncbi:hypothetical protein FQR65_LT20581 [Abscondita terminalis]|nr:hypothetical protein FQR65_LT20581 [Abscondita terminalis]
MEEYGFRRLIWLNVDLYPFEKTVASGASEADIIEKIDIGGISLIRAAAKNFKDTVIVASVDQYAEFLEPYCQRIENFFFILIIVAANCDCGQAFPNLKLLTTLLSKSQTITQSDKYDYPDAVICFDRNGVPFGCKQPRMMSWLLPKDVKDIDIPEFCKLLKITETYRQGRKGLYSGIQELLSEWYPNGGWRSTTIVSNAIGQGEVSTTPIQLANMMAAVANERLFIHTPYLKKFQEHTIE